MVTRFIRNLATIVTMFQAALAAQRLRRPEDMDRVVNSM